MTSVEVTRIPAANGLDPITVYVENLAPGRGRMVVQCYARAWTAFWGAMGDHTMQQFVLRQDPDYVVGNMLCALESQLLKRHVEREQQYLASIVRAVQAAFAQAENVTPGTPRTHQNPES